MELTTQCPRCNTRFSATLQQLQLRKGYIRCVQCQHIFDGYEAVVPGDPAQDAVADPRPPASQAPAHRHIVSDPAPQAVPLAERHVMSDPSPAAVRLPVRTRREFTISEQGAAHDAGGRPMSGLGKDADDASVLRGQEPVLGRVAAPVPDRPEPALRQGDDTAPRARAYAPVPHDNESGHPPADDSREPFLDDAGAPMPDDGGASPQYRRDAARHRRHDDLPGRRTPDEHGGQGMAGIAWGAVIALGLVLLVLQLLVVFRVQIAETLPPARPALEAICARLNCTVAWSRQLDAILITHSALQREAEAARDPDAKDGEADTARATATNDATGQRESAGQVPGQPAGSDAGAQTDHFTLHVTLRNTLDKPQEWPTLVLELTDAAGVRVARRNLDADTYLPADVAAGPFPAASERRISLPLTLHGLNVNGYQLTTFFP